MSERQIARQLPGAEHLTSVSVERTESGTTSRARLHLQWDEPGHPASVFVKVPAEGRAARWFGTAVGLGRTEARFYREIRAGLDLPAPECFLATTGRFGRFIVVLEDLDAEFPTVADGATVAQAEAVVDALARVHGSLWDSPRFDGDLAWVRRPSAGGGRRQMEKALLRSAVRTARRRFPEELDGDVGRLLDLARSREQALDRLRDRPPVTLLHGDTHLGNTYFLADGSAGLFDWQVVQRGPGIRDVAYFLVLSLPSELRAAHERELVGRYQAAVGADDLWDAYRLYAVDPFRAAVFTAAMGDRLQPERQWRTGLDRAVAAVTDLATLDALESALPS
jgi:aminoglycoside phosphotransferase (APT) family kinase protein